MKRFIFIFMFAVWTSASGAFAEELVDGFCTMEVLEMERATALNATSTAVRGKAKAFYEKSLLMAKKLYTKASPYHDEWPIEVYKSYVLFGQSLDGSGRRMLGSKITLHMNADEDHITYYFYRHPDSEEPKLKMYLHDEQSAMAYWTCEY